MGHYAVPLVLHFSATPSPAGKFATGRLGILAGAQNSLIYSHSHSLCVTVLTSAT